MHKDRLLLVGIAALSAVATAGWMRTTPVAVAPQAMHFNAPMDAPVLDPAAFPVQSTGFAVAPAGVTSGVYHQTAPAAQVVRTSAARRASSSGYATRPVQRVYDDRRVYDDAPRTYTKKRSTAKSAAIIGGSAAAGAAVGAMAGGGKGAAIGAVAGGAGGYVYDRATRNKTEDVDSYRSSGVGYRDDDGVYRTERSPQKRAAIIGGSAAAGAAVGAIAGGGKGAAIGAITGGAGGYVYDRMTKDRR